MSAAWRWSATSSSTEPLAGLPRLTLLTLTNDRVGCFEPLAGVTSLTFLKLSGNLVTDVTPLAG